MAMKSSKPRRPACPRSGARAPSVVVDDAGGVHRRRVVSGWPAIVARHVLAMLRCALVAGAGAFLLDFCRACVAAAGGGRRSWSAFVWRFSAQAPLLVGCEHAAVPLDEVLMYGSGNRL